MATFTSIKSGNWSSNSTWDQGTVPGDLDLVVVSPGHNVVFDVDQESFGLGMIGVVVNGTLSFDTSTSKKFMRLFAPEASSDPPIRGTGVLRVGAPGTPVPVMSSGAPTVTIAAQIAGSGVSQLISGLSAVTFWGAGRDAGYWATCFGTPGTATAIKIKSGTIDLRPGDVICTAGATSVPIFRTVTSFSGGTIYISGSIGANLVDDQPICNIRRAIRVETSNQPVGLTDVANPQVKDTQLVLQYSDSAFTAGAVPTNSIYLENCSLTEAASLVVGASGGTIKNLVAAGQSLAIINCANLVLDNIVAISNVSSVLDSCFGCRITNVVSWGYARLCSNCTDCHINGGTAINQHSLTGVALLQNCTGCSAARVMGSGGTAVFAFGGGDCSMYECTMLGGRSAFSEVSAVRAVRCNFPPGTPVLDPPPGALSRQGLPYVYSESVNENGSISHTIWANGGSAVYVATPTPLGSGCYRLSPGSVLPILVPFEVQVPPNGVLSANAAFYRTAPISDNKYVGYMCPFIEVVRKDSDPRLAQFTGYDRLHYLQLALAHSGTVGSATWEVVSVEAVNTEPVPADFVVRVGQNGVTGGSPWPGTAYVAVDWEIG